MGEYLSKSNLDLHYEQNGNENDEVNKKYKK
mgnify:CR=1 FL=1